MKSEKARAYLNSSSMNPNSPLAQDQCYVWRDASVIKAIELVEQEAEEMAVVAFKKVLGNLMGDVVSSELPELIEFIAELNNS